MSTISKGLTAFFENYAKENKMLPDEAVRELEAHLFNDYSEKIAEDLTIYLDLLLVIPTKDRQQKLYITIMTYLMNEIVTTEYPIEKALHDLRFSFKRFLKNKCEKL